MKSRILALTLVGTALTAGIITGCTNAKANSEISFTDFVNPKIGSGGHGHVFVGANTPYGMVQLGPTSVPVSWDWCSGYHDSDSTIIGFSHTHLSGTGIGDLFDVTVMPVTGEVAYARGTLTAPDSGMWSYGDRSREIARPGYYSIPLERYGILAELTATPRVGVHRYTFPKSDSAAIVFDLQNGGCWDRPTETILTAENDSLITGYRRSKGWAADQHIYFAAQFSKPFDTFELKGDENMFGRASFKTAEGEQVLLKVGISPVSVEGAKANLAAEMPGWDFEGTRQAADKLWNDELSKVKISTDDSAEKETFYTALYHTKFVPAIFNDVDGKYRGADGEIHTKESANYTIFSLWDTYRAQMPLLSILDPERTSDMVNTMIDIADQQGRLPVWHLWANETDCMVGNPGIIPVADAIVKNIDGVDKQKAFEAIKATAMNQGRGNNLRMQYGFIPCDLMNEAIAYDMEYAVADGAAALAAKAIGDSASMKYFTDRSHSYRNYFDKTTGFIRGYDSKGNWRTPFNPFQAEHRADDYCEGNAWQYTWLAPHDVDGLVDCFGSKENMIVKLDSLFTVSSEVVGEDSSPDISGMIGQYAHGNEPGHHILYLYTLLGQPDKGAEKIREVLTTLYSNKPDGLSGNEDAGQMSAWYVLSALGFYELEPASGRYVFGTPLFSEASIEVPGGQFLIQSHNNSKENMYVEKVKLNGKDYTLPYIDYADIMKGGKLEFFMKQRN